MFPVAELSFFKRFCHFSRARRYLFSFAVLLLAVTGSHAAMQRVHSDTAAIVSTLKPLTRLSATKQLRLAISLPLRNQQALTDFLRQLQDPSSPNYRKYLTPAQFAGRFGPTEQDYQAVIAFANTHGLTVTARHSNRMVLDVAGAVSDIEKAFHVTMRTYQHPREPRQFYAASAEPTLDLPVPILGIAGLDNYSIPRPMVKFMDHAAFETPHLGSGLRGTYLGADFRRAYVPGSPLAGTGQTVALLEFDGYDINDIYQYEALAGYQNIPITNRLIDGFDGIPSGTDSEVEVALDIEMVNAMAPQLGNLLVYETDPSDSGFLDIIETMVTDDEAQSISSSWSTQDGAPNPAADAIFQEMAAQGQSMFQASGDSDASSGPIAFPGDSPYITEVGGTIVNTLRGSYLSERVWNAGGGIGSSGGVSTSYPIPYWQQGTDMAGCHGSTTYRNVPDVALTAYNVFAVEGGSYYGVEGTSCAAPLWAGFIALVNEQALNESPQRPPVGFINPAIYAIGNEWGYGPLFHDIRVGNNFDSESRRNYQAVPGYDLCTGWGTPSGTPLINVLANGGEPLQVSFSSFVASGTAGHLMAPSSTDYTLANGASHSLNWRASVAQDWLTLSSSSGTVGVSGSYTVVASLNARAGKLPPGTYLNTVYITDLTTRVEQRRTVVLTLVPPSAILSVTPGTGLNVSGVVGGPFTPSSATYQVTNAGNVPMKWTVSNTTGWLSAAPSGGTLAGGSSTIVTATISSSVDLFLQGSYADTLKFSNRTNSVGDISIPVKLTVLPLPPVVTSQALPAASEGQPFSYQIEASGSPTGYGSSNLPPGLSCDPITGLISGSPIASGSSVITVTASNPGGSGTGTLTLVVSSSAPAIIGGTSVSGLLNQPFTWQIAATNFPASYAASGLPAGLSLDSATGVVSGTATVTGTYTSTVSASNLEGTGSAALSIAIAASPAPQTALYFYSSTNSQINGASGFYTPGSSVSFVPFDNSSLSEVGAEVVLPGSYWTVGIFTPGGQTLTTGTYYAPTSYAGTSAPAFLFSSGGGEAPATTVFEVPDISYGVTNLAQTYLNTLAVDFVQYDGGDPDAWSVGSLRYNSLVPIPYPTPPALSGFEAIPFGTDTDYMSGTVNSGREPVQLYVQYGLTTAYSFTTPAQFVPPAESTESVLVPIQGLQPNTTYHYRLLAASPAGIAATPDAIFTTVAANPPPPVITSATTASVLVNAPFTYQIAASNNPMFFGATGLPAGLSVNSTTGLVTGSISTSGDTRATITATNGGGTGSATLSIDVTEPLPVLTFDVYSIETVGQYFQGQILATQYPTSYRAVGLPQGLTVDKSTGFVSGSVMQAGTTTAVLSATGPTGTGTTAFTFVFGTPPVITSANSAAAEFDAPFTFQVTATNDPYEYFTYPLPMGLTQDPNTGVISGIPEVIGPVYTTVYAENGFGTGSAPLIINVGTAGESGNARVPNVVAAAGPTSFADWQRRWFSAPQLADPKVSGTAACPAGDGVPNLLRYALDLSPAANAASALPVVSVTAIDGDRYLTLKFTRWVAPTDIVYVPEVSGDAQTWKSGSEVVIPVCVTVNKDGTETVVVRDRTATTSTAPRFIRLEVTGK